jgi:hypothetical protein
LLESELIGVSQMDERAPGALVGVNAGDLGGDDEYPCPSSLHVRWGEQAPQAPILG